jgi:L-ascorbate metabolism protein UlaG (beta-lactamase superfamily)
MVVRLGFRALVRIGFTAVAVVCAAAAAQAQRVQAPAPKPEMMEACPGLVAHGRPPVVPASFQQALFQVERAALAADQIRITYAGHSTFLLESPSLVRIATDYNDWVRPPVLPDVVTMNRAHSSHYTDRPDPGIKYVLRGWAEGEAPARHDVNVKDVRIRNVPTNIRDWGGGTQRHGNSIFIFETAQLCIAHLGHLHHTLTQEQLNEIGRVDIVFVPVDGGATLDLDGMVEVLQSLKPKLMIPMHFFSVFTLNRFLDRVRDQWDVETADIPSVVISKTNLPEKPKVLVLPGR